VTFLLSLKFIARRGTPSTALTGMDILHVIWIFRNHPRLAEECEQVSDPTDENLRATGMVRVQLDADGEVIELQNQS
jgi:uncharacterized membrane protein